MTRLKSTLCVCLGALAITALQASANVFTFVTPPGATTGGGPVDASATITTGAGTITISLTDLQANPTDIAQLISDFDFTLLNTPAVSVGPLNSSGTEITVNGDGTTTLGSTGSTGWGLNFPGPEEFQLDALGFVGPAHLIIGPPGPGGVYTAANGSIAGNPPHNPFLNQTAMFTITDPFVSDGTNITGATFSFGTTEGANIVPGIPQGEVPEPATLALLGIGLAGLGFSRRRKQ